DRNLPVGVDGPVAGAGRSVDHDLPAGHGDAAIGVQPVALGVNCHRAAGDLQVETTRLLRASPGARGVQPVVVGRGVARAAGDIDDGRFQRCGRVADHGGSAADPQCRLSLQAVVPHGDGELPGVLVQPAEVLACVVGGLDAIPGGGHGVVAAEHQHVVPA